MILDKVKNELRRLKIENTNIIHIAGSKGKGTCAQIINFLLQKKGFKVGIFTSPFIEHARESICVNGIQISEKTFAENMDRIDLSLSEFERLTICALMHFQKEKCDYTILECGWGGAIDATNAIENKIITILTHIELEHLGILGNNLQEICIEKLGICRKNVPLVTSIHQKKELIPIIKNACKNVYFARNKNIQINGVNLHHPESAGIAIKVLEVLKIKTQKNEIYALKNTNISTKFAPKKHKNFTIIYDGAHTIDSVKYAIKNIKKYAKNNQFDRTIFAVHILKDKSRKILNLFPTNSRFWVQIKDERASEQPKNWDQFNLEKIKNSNMNFKTLLVFIGTFKLQKSDQLML